MSGLPEEFEAANHETFVSITGKRTGTEYDIRGTTYGALTTDQHDPLSLVSVANSSLSIDLWKGCAWQCAYCHVQGDIENLDEVSLEMPKQPQERSRFGSQEVIDRLVEHPFFERDETIISIGTASTEPFASGKVAESTFEIMEDFVGRGYKNPFWIVTKGGFPKSYGDRLRAICEGGTDVMISFCWANNPEQVEPVQNNRFRNIDVAHAAGATTSWYLRPIAEGWGASYENLREAFEHASGYAPYIDMIVPGGLRWTEGIEYGVSEVRGQEMPAISRDDNVKELSDETWQHIYALAAEFFPDRPLLLKSSCSLSNMLAQPNHNLVQLRNAGDCASSHCPDAQRARCGTFSLPKVEQIRDRLAEMGLGTAVTVHDIDARGTLSTEPPLNEYTFAVQRAITSQIVRLGSNG